MKVLYIGSDHPGTTSSMRARAFDTISAGQTDVINTDAVFRSHKRIARTISFRFKCGPVVAAVNNHILSELKRGRWDVAWVDKGIWVRPETVSAIRRQCGTVVHYTPDAAFLANRSRIFEASISKYDFVVTTKRFEQQQYQALIPPERLLFCTQGYDPAVHRSTHGFEQKEHAVVFVGLYEPSRGVFFGALAEAGIPLRIAGHGWQRFLRSQRHRAHVQFLGPALWNEDYARVVSRARFAAGLLSKRFPEQHTTRTIEIPACGTALLSEPTDEVKEIFTDREAIFFNGPSDAIEAVNRLACAPEKLQALTEAGRARISGGPFAYPQLLQELLRRIYT